MKYLNILSWILMIAVLVIVPATWRDSLHGHIALVFGVFAVFLQVFIKNGH